MRDGKLAEQLALDPESLASMSIGRPSRGALFNAIQMPPGPLWHVVEPDHAWATDETIAAIMAAIERVGEAFPGTPELYIGHLSSRRGGYLRPHRSHQSGRDADLGYYYSAGPGWYVRASAKSLDVPRTWALVEALATDPNVEGIFIDRSIQALLREHAERSGESKSWLRTIFEGRPDGSGRLIRHEWGHLTHLHVRFRNPIAEEAGLRAHRQLEAMDRGQGRRYVSMTASLSRARHRSRS